MIGPDLWSSAFQVLSALAVTENRSARGNMAPVERKTASRYGKQQATPDSGALSPAVPNSYSGALSPSPAASLWDLNAIDPEGRRNAEHIAIIVVVDLVPIQCHFRSRRPQAQQPLYQDAHTATGPAQGGHRPEG